MFVSFLEFLEDNEGVMAAIGAFGFIPLGLLAYALSKLLGSFASVEKPNLITSKLTVWAVICWLVDFISQVMLHFLAISPIQRFFIYVSMLLVVFIAVFTNNKIVILYDSLKDQMDQEKQRRRR